MRPVDIHAVDYPADHVIGLHAHAHAQIVYASAGVMVVTTAEGEWVTPSHRAVWVPGGVPHRVRMSGPVAMRTVYLRPDLRDDLPRHCAVLQVSALMRELILRLVDPRLPTLPEADAPIVALLLDELAAAPQAPLSLPLPHDTRLHRVTEALLADPADARTLRDWARTAAASEKTLARLFQRETGLSFGAWRQQLRLIRALEALAGGATVTETALALGYDSPSAFVAMFRRAMGTTPGRFFDRPDAGA